MRCAVGFSVHTGWAACVVAAGTNRAPRVVRRETIELLGDPDRFVYHRAAEMDLAQATQAVDRATNAAGNSAARELERIIQSHANIVGCAIVAKRGTPSGTLAEILAAHPRIHSAEGCLYRDALASAATALGLEVSIIAPKELESSELIDGLGKKIGPPWAKDQRLAALAAWTMLQKR